MSKRKKQPDPRSLKDQIEAYILEGVAEFEQISGVRVERIDVKHYRSIGFGGKETMEVNIVTE